MKKNFFLVCFLLINIYSYAQVTGTWELFASYRNIEQLAYSDNKIFAKAKNGLLVLDKSTGEITSFTKANLLSSVNIRAISYNRTNDMLAIGYQDGLIDLLDKSLNIHRINILANNISIYDKTINSIKSKDNYVYLATGFGVVKLDLNNMQIEQMIKLSAQYEETNTFDIEIFNDSLWAATEQGIYTIPLGKDLSLFDNWKLKNTSLFVTQMCASDNFLVLNSYDTTLGTRKIITYDKSNYTDIASNLPAETKIRFTDNKLFILYNKHIIESDENGNITKDITSYANGKAVYPNDIISDNNTIFTADRYQGLTKDLSGIPLFSNCPFSDLNSAIAIANDKIFLCSQQNAEDSANGYIGIVSIYENGQWTNLSTGINNISAIAIDPKNNNHFFVGSTTDGLAEIQNYSVINLFNTGNSSLQNNIDGKPEINSLLFDNDTLWILNNSQYPVKYMATDKSFGYVSSSAVAANIQPINFVKTAENKVWVTLGTEGILAIDLTDNYAEKFYPLRLGVGAAWAKSIIEVELDQNDKIWIGAKYGMGYIYYTDFQKSHYVVWPQIQIEVNDTTIGTYLFYGYIASVIKIDPADRKWVGTGNNGGIFLVSEDCSEQIHNFRIDNSPLPDNNITDIAINYNTGEVLIQTQNGLVSYVSDASLGKDNFDNVKIFPNPVRPEFNGVVTIEGLMDKTLIKITDIQGNLVYEMRSEGGRAIWNLQNLNGQKVASGVYFVMCTTETASKKCIKKIMIIN